jgi:HK97 family phage prohead protease
MKKLLTKRCDAAEFKMTDEGPGGFTGYASVFDVVDRGGDIVAKGAFAGSLDAFRRDGFIAVGHDWGQSGVATIKSAEEDAHGLLIEAEFHSTPDAQAERVKLKERLERGKSVGLSIGFQIADGGTERDKATKARRLTKIDLFEVSIVTVPMNAEAQAIAAKAATSAAEAKALFEDVLAERVPSLWELWDVMTTCIARIVRLAHDAEGTGTVVDAESLLDEATGEFVARMRATVLERVESGETYYYGFEIPNGEPPAGLTFAAHADAVLAAADGLLARAKTITALRAKDNRRPSLAHTQAMAALAARLDEIKGAAGAIAPPDPEPEPVLSAEDSKALRTASLRAISRASVVAAK